MLSKEEKARILIEKYPDIDPEIINSYQDGDEYFIANERDLDFDNIVVPLPETPMWDEIEGFGLPPSQQKWKPIPLPERLQSISEDALEWMKKKSDSNKIISVGLEDVWEYLYEFQRDYKEEIEFIKNQWRCRLRGKWVFINGKAYFIDGWHWFYMSWWTIDVGLPVFRSRDWYFFHFARFTSTTTMVPVVEKDTMTGKVKAIIKDGFALLSDLGRRVCFGFNYPKHRREGATSKASCINYCIASTTVLGHTGIQSMNDDDAEMVYLRHILEPWKTLPFFFRPYWKGSSAPQGKMSFQRQGKKQGGSGAVMETKLELGGEMTFGPSNRSTYDGQKLFFFHDDEVGKLITEDLMARHKVVRECLSQGAGSLIHGFNIKTSTVGKMEKGGGKNFHMLCKQSNFFNRNDNGQTISGNYNLFIPAEDGLDGFIDEFGISVIEDPAHPVMGIHGGWITIGSRTYLNNARQGYLDAGDVEGYMEQVRLFPQQSRECFITGNSDSPFDIRILDKRISELTNGEGKKGVRGNFSWENGVQDTRVLFTADPKGKFMLYLALTQKQSNLVHYDAQLQHYVPSIKNKFVAGSDPFKYQKTAGTRKSNGAGGVKYLWDSAIDPINKPAKDWVSDKFVCQYNCRVDSLAEYAEDMLMMCVYFGCYMFPEVNVTIVWDHFDDRGYGGMLLYDIDGKGKLKNVPGYTVVDSGNTNTKQKIFSLTGEHIKRRGEYEDALEYLEQCYDIGGPEHMSEYDQFAANGGCLLGEAVLKADIGSNRYGEGSMSEKQRSVSFFPKRTYGRR